MSKIRMRTKRHTDKEFSEKEKLKNRERARANKEKIIEAFGGKCSYCSYSIKIALQIHHIDGNNSNNNLENLILLCANCHCLSEGQITKSELSDIRQGQKKDYKISAKTCADKNGRKITTFWLLA
jgi:predicted HNH restriction endonuclease